MFILDSSWRRAMLGLALAAGSRALPAQATSQPLPPELVTALFSDNNYASASSQYFVGVVPPGWPTEIVPAPPITVSGGMRTDGRRFAVFVDSTTRHPRDTLRRQLETAGWTRPPNEPAQGFVQGFQADYGHYDFWCRDSVRATLRSTPGADEMTYVRVGLETLRGGGCLPMPQQHMVEHAILLLPPLLPPKGVQTISGSGGSGGTGLSASTRLRDSTMTPGALLAHYVAQLVRAGWTVHPPTATAAFALQALEARDKDGVPWYGMMLVIATRDARSISVMMNRTPNQ